MKYQFSLHYPHIPNAKSSGLNRDPEDILIRTDGVWRRFGTIRGRILRGRMFRMVCGKRWIRTAGSSILVLRGLGWICCSFFFFVIFFVFLKGGWILRG